MKLERWQIAKNLIEHLDKLTERKYHLMMMKTAIESDPKSIDIVVGTGNYPNLQVPIYNQVKIIEFIEFQIEETNDLLELRKHEFDNL